MYFDSHAHLTEDCFAQDFDTIVENMKAASVTGMMEIGFDLPSSEKAVQPGACFLRNAAVASALV